MAQSDYLNRVQQDARNQYQLKRDEQIVKEAFRKRLERLCQDTLHEQYPNADFSDVRLKCYGSLNNGFGLANCDMDLLLALPEGFTPVLQSTDENIIDPVKKVAKMIEEDDNSSQTSEETRNKSRKEKFAVGWLLEEAFLKDGIGARLLTQTRVPILKVCETPSKDLLENLKKNHKQEMASNVEDPQLSTDASSLPPSFDMGAVQTALSDLEDQDSAAQVSLPDVNEKPLASELEFDEDCGIKCDVNFSNFVALHNTRLLREYCLYDSRVAEVGVFVKTWAKIRDINTPYWGTLSSYGYVLMVLHYLMNICTPPVIPNLQYLAADEDAWENVSPELFEGKYNIRFLIDQEKIQNVRQTSPMNRESTGQLLRGFFWYYASWEGFNFKNDVISIRTKGGLLKKYAKKWTEGKWVEGSDNKKVRQRYLLAIEDPFEVEHNVGRVVGHHGIVAIRDEFRRAWDIISKIDGSNMPYEDLLQPAEQRGDLLRKDAENHKEKMRQMRAQLEEKERKMKEQSLQETSSIQQNGTSSDNDSSPRPLSLHKRAGNHRHPKSKLTQHDTFQEPPRWNRPGRVRLIKDDSDSDGDDEQTGDTDSIRRASEPVKLEKDIAISEAEQDSNHNQEHLEPFHSGPEPLDDIGVDSNGNLTPWPATNDGRWLRWRDRKIEKGMWRKLSTNSVFYHLDRVCQYHPDRPKLDDAGEYRRYERFERAPFPLKNDAGVTSSQQKLGDRILQPVQNNDHHVAEVASEASQPPNQPTTDAVGWPILWDKRTLAGKWLRKRDIAIRKGRFKLSDHSGKYQRLHYLFPYNPQMSQAKLEAYNADLQAYHKVTIDRDAPSTMQRERNRKPLSQEDLERALELRLFSVPSKKQPRACESEVIHLEADEPSGEEHDFDGLYHSLRMTDELRKKVEQWSKDDQIRFSSLLAQAEQQSEQPTEDDTMPNLAFLRSRRLAFYAQQARNEGLADDTESEGPGTTIESLMAKMGIHPDEVRSGGKLPETPLKGETVGQIESSEVPTKELSETKQLSNPEPMVPSTLYPDHSEEDRPRDEDPNIMPIPRSPHFQFDIRQLRDLAVIQEGGNGCARQGSEFEVEDEYQWGGGGEMGIRQDTDVAQADEDDTAELEYEHGHGDKEGLLEELPACGFDD